MRRLYFPFVLLSFVLMAFADGKTGYGTMDSTALRVCFAGTVASTVAATVCALTLGDLPSRHRGWVTVLVAASDTAALWLLSRP